jgi:hypothetical protein
LLQNMAGAVPHIYRKKQVGNKNTTLHINTLLAGP